MSCHWQAHATFTPAGEMFFGLQADTAEEASDSAHQRVAQFGLPLGQLELTLLHPADDRNR